MDERERRIRFESLYDRYVRLVLGYALRRLEREAAQDLVADTFLVAWRRIEEVPDDPAPWLIGIARNVLLNSRRSRARRGRLLERLRGERGAADVAVEDEGLDPALVEALMSLPPADRELLCLIAWERLDHEGAARVLGCSTGAIRLRLHRARKRLRVALEDAGPQAASSSPPTGSDAR